MSSSSLVAAFLLLANLSFLVFQNELNALIALAFILQSTSPTSLSFISPPPGSQRPVSLHAHLLPTIDNIPDGAPLLATHRQINRSNNTPINSNYALISPGRSLLGAGERM